jgi:hypothetical protein
MHALNLLCYFSRHIFTLIDDPGITSEPSCICSTLCKYSANTFFYSSLTAWAWGARVATASSIVENI